MLREEGQHDVELLFDAELAPLILNAQHHEGEQAMRRKDGSVEYRVTLSSLPSRSGTRTEVKVAP